MGFDFNLAAQAGPAAVSLAPKVRQNLRSVPGIRRSNSMGSAYLPRMSSAVSRADTSISSLAEASTSWHAARFASRCEAQSTVLLVTANGSKAPGKADSPPARSAAWCTRTGRGKSPT